MANSLESNISTVVYPVIATGFESNRVSTKTVDTTSLAGKHKDSTGSIVYEKRKTSYRGTETATGDISGSAPNNGILVGNIPFTVQNVITVDTDWTAVEEALELNQLDQLLMPMGEELITIAERNFNDFIITHAGLTYGDPDTPVTTWSDVANVEALMHEIGVPTAGNKYYQMNSYTSATLAGLQTGLAADGQVRSAWENAVVSSPLAGMISLKSNALRSFTAGTATDRAGTLAANPDVTWATHKDTMIQSISVSGFTASATIKAGEVIEVTGRHHVNPRNSNVLLDATNTQVKFRWTVVSDVTLDGTGAGTVSVTNAAIFDAASNNQYDNIDSAPVSGDVITVLGTENTVYKPNLAYHKDAFCFATVKLPALNSTSTTYTTEDGLSFRMTKFSSELENKQQIRVDMMPAFGVKNPLHAVRCYG